MKKIIIFLAGMIYCSVHGGSALTEWEIDETVVRTLNVYPQFITTVMFPAMDGIKSIHGSNITKSTKAPAGFFIEYQPGAAYFSIRAMEANPKDAFINVMYQKKIIPLRITVTDQQKNAHVIVVFKEPLNSATGGGGHKNNVTPAILVGLIDKAKAYHVLNEYQPGALSDCDFGKLMQVTSFPRFDVIVDEGYRFDRYDTNVFKIYLRNKSSEKVVLDVETFTVRVGSQLLTSSIVESAGVIPPNGTVIAFAGFTGTASGGRNNLAILGNKWKFLVNEKKDKNEGLINQAQELIKKINDHLTPDEAAAIKESLKKIEMQTPSLNGFFDTVYLRLDNIMVLNSRDREIEKLKLKIDELKKEKEQNNDKPADNPGTAINHDPNREGFLISDNKNNVIYTTE